MNVAELIQRLRTIPNQLMPVQMDGFVVEDVQVILDEQGEPYLELIPLQ